MAVVNHIKEHNIIFIHIPKNGGSSIRRGFFENKFDKYVGPNFPKEWEKMFKFTFVRNPFDRFISAYKMFTEGFVPENRKLSWNNPKPMSIEEFFEKSKRDKNYTNVSGMGFHTIPQTHELNFLKYSDFVGRFENLEEDFRKVCEMNNINFTSLPHWNKTNREDYRTYFDENLYNKISEYYSEDLKLLDYQF
jgi:hypothetical protein